MVATCRRYQRGLVRYRLKGSTLLGHDPAEPLKQPVDAEQVKSFYQKWYTPDAMTLIVVGNVDSRAVVEQINKAFGDLKGKRETPALFRRSLRCVQSLSAL